MSRDSSPKAKHLTLSSMDRFQELQFEGLIIKNKQAFETLPNDIMQYLLKLLITDDNGGFLAASRLLLTNKGLLLKYYRFFNKATEYLAQIKKFSNHNDYLILLTQGGRLLRVPTAEREVEHNNARERERERELNFTLDSLANIFVRNYWCNDLSIMILTQDGFLYAAGEQYNGNLGVGKLNRFIPEPERVLLDVPIIEIMSGNPDETYFLGKDGNVYFSGQHPLTHEVITKPTRFNNQALECKQMSYSHKGPYFLSQNGDVYKFNNHTGFQQMNPPHKKVAVMCSFFYGCFYFCEEGRVYFSGKLNSSHEEMVFSLFAKNQHSIDRIVFVWTRENNHEISIPVFVCQNETKVYYLPPDVESVSWEHVREINIPLDEGESLKEVHAMIREIKILTSKGIAYNCSLSPELRLTRLEGRKVAFSASGEGRFFIIGEDNSIVGNDVRNVEFSGLAMHNIRPGQIKFRMPCTAVLNEANKKEIWVSTNPRRGALFNSPWERREAPAMPQLILPSNFKK